MAFIPGTQIEQPGPQFVTGAPSAGVVPSVQQNVPIIPQTSEDTAKFLKDFQNMIAQYSTILASAPPPVSSTVITDPVTKKQYIPDATGKYVPYISSSQPAPSPTPFMANAAVLTANADIERLKTKIETQQSEIKTGVFTGRSALLTDLLAQAGIKEEQTALNEFNKTILREQKRLEALPESIRTSLADVGISQPQLDRLTARDSEQILKQLNEAMRNAGATQDRINQSLKMVGLFFDAGIADQAAKVEALKYDLETNKFLYGKMDADLKDLTTQALNTRNAILKIADEGVRNGLTDQNVIKQIQSAGSVAEAQTILAGSGFGVEQQPTDLIEEVVGGFKILRDKKTGKVISAVSAKEDNLGLLLEKQLGEISTGKVALEKPEEKGWYQSIKDYFKESYQKVAAKKATEEILTHSAIPSGYIQPIDLSPLNGIIDSTLNNLGLGK